MFANVELGSGAGKSVVTVPNSAVIDSGTRRIVLVRLQEGRFEPREVRLGMRGDDYVEVLEGVKEGEQVVVAANFLIDAESNLKAAVGSFSSPEQGKALPAGAGHKAEGTVDSIDAKEGTVSLNHGPVPSLGWPGMAMDFKLANESLLKDLTPGASIQFEFVERQPGEYVITSVQSAASTPKAGKTPSGHSHEGH
jgi:Cu(I)/Ag(I) efflux system membrane fusion protein